MRAAAPVVPSFAPPWWLRGAHAQTVWGPLTRFARPATARREVLATPDGDDLVLDHLDVAAGAPVVLLLHGLEGSSFSVYVQGLARECAARGWNVAALNFRYCARDQRGRRTLPNRRPRLYHSAETGDLDFALRTLAARAPAAPTAAIGASLGANVLLRWLGERGGRSTLRAAVAISPPFDLARGAERLARGAGRVYALNFLRTLKPKLRDLARRFPEVAATLDVPRALAARTLREFDDAATAPLHGFAGVDDYYERAEATTVLPEIATPTLVIGAEDDPFLAPGALDAAASAAPRCVTFLEPRAGGHLGFVEGGAPWRARYWAETQAAAWLAARLGP